SLTPASIATSCISYLWGHTLQDNGVDFRSIVLVFSKTSLDFSTEPSRSKQGTDAQPWLLRPPVRIDLWILILGHPNKNGRRCNSCTAQNHMYIVTYLPPDVHIVTCTLHHMHIATYGTPRHAGMV